MSKIIRNIRKLYITLTNMKTCPLNSKNNFKNKLHLNSFFGLFLIKINLEIYKITELFCLGSLI